MLKKITKWETEDGKVFDTQEEAEDYMFEQEKGAPAALLQLADLLESGRHLFEVERREAANALRWTTQQLTIRSKPCCEAGIS